MQVPNLVRQVAALATCAAAAFLPLQPSASAQPAAEVPVIAGAVSPEMRAMWVSRFEWPSSSQATAKSNIDTIMATIAANNFNTVLFQVRGQCDVHYPSPYEPWSDTYGWTDPGWDPLAYAIQKAHDNGLKFHAYMNTHTLAQPVPPASTTPQHKYNLHGPNVPAAQSWMIRTSPGASAGLVDGYYWISPGIPEASAWTRQAILHVVKNYNVDGVHFDRIRTPGSTYSHDPVTEARFAGEGNPDGLSFGDFMRSQITRDLRNIYGEIAYHKPDVQISAAPFGIVYKDATTNYQGFGTQSYHQWYQDSWGWMSSHVVDFMVPQIYWQVGSAHPFELLLQDWMERAGGRHVVAGSTTNSGGKTVAALLDEHAQTRLQNAHGHTVFSYSSMGSYWNSFLTQRYQAPAPLPEMPWKTAPTDGIITGYVVDLNGDPVLDAVINRGGDSYNYLSAYDGFFSMLDVPPGAAHTLSASKANVGERTLTGVSVTAGNVTSVTLVLTNSQGSISLDRDRYAPGAVAEIFVSDGDLAGQPDVTVFVSSTSDSTPEPLQLPAEGVGGAFRGTVALPGGVAVPGDGTVHVQHGDTVQVTYTDQNDGEGNVVVVSDSAEIDGVGPVISNVSTGNLFATSAIILFDTDELATGVVRFGTACGAWTGQSAPGPLTTSHALAVGGLTPDTTYYYQVEAADDLDNASTDNNGGACYQFHTPLISVGLEETFEAGLNGWTATGLWRYIDNTDPCASAHSPTRSWYYGTNSCTYNTGSTNSGRLTSPEFMVPAGAALRFWSRESTEGGTTWDTRRVFVSIGAVDTLVYASTNNANAWYQTPAVDLSAFAGQQVQLVFEFDTVDSVANDYAGWYVDDVSVQGPVASTNPSPPNGAVTSTEMPMLSWQNQGGWTSFNVYFGTTNPPPFAANVSSLAFNPGALDFGSQYYWRVDSLSGPATATGSTWTFMTPAPPEVSITPDAFSTRLEPDTVATTSILVANEATPGAANLQFVVNTEVENPTVAAYTIGTGALSASGSNRYRGCIYEATKSGVLRQIESALGFGGALSINYVVFESTTLSGTYNRIFTSDVVHTGTGTGFYSSGSINVPMTAGRFYIVAVGWSGAVVAYPYSIETLPVNYGFGIMRNGYGLDSYPVGTTAFNAGNVNTYQQRLTVENMWLVASPASIPATVPPQASGTAMLTIRTHGLADGFYSGKAIVLSNDPDNQNTTATVSLEVKSRPAAVTNLTPPNGAGPLFGDVNLSWDPSAGADNYNVYLGTTNPPPFHTVVGSPPVIMNGLAPGTTHYWRVDAENVMGATTGPVFSFATAAVSGINDWSLY